MCQGAWFHKWSDWVPVPFNAADALKLTGLLIVPKTSRAYGGDMEKFRVCARCNKIDVRYVPHGH